MSLLKKYLSERSKLPPQDTQDEGTGAGTTEKGGKQIKQDTQMKDNDKHKEIQKEGTERTSLSVNFREQLKMFDLKDEKLPVNINQISYVPNALTESCGKAIMECIESGTHEWTYLKTRKLQYFGVSLLYVRNIWHDIIFNCILCMCQCVNSVICCILVQYSCLNYLVSSLLLYSLQFSSLKGLPEKSRVREELPPWLADISEVLVERKIFPSSLAPNHVLINQYQPGEGIMHHTDGPLYHDCVVILTLGFPAVMSFQPRLTTEQIGSASQNSTNSIFNENHSNSNENDVDKIANAPIITTGACSILLRPNSLLYFSNEAYSSYLHGIDTWDHVLTEEGDLHQNDHNQNYNCQLRDSFFSHVSSLPHVIDKTEQGEAFKTHAESDSRAEVTEEGDQLRVLYQEQQQEFSDKNCIRTSLTIRHMF